MEEIESRGTLLLRRSEVAGLLHLDTCIAAVEDAFRLHGSGLAPDPAIAAVHVEDGGFHVKAGVLDLGHVYFAAKTNANFMNNGKRYGLPTIQGTIVLHDAENGFPLAVMDSIAISVLRTGAATAVAARVLARPDSEVVAVIGCGKQGHVQLRSLSRVLQVRQALVWDIDPVRSGELAETLARELGIDIRVVEDVAAAASNSDVVVTCTPSTRYLLEASMVQPGTFVAGVGVDNPQKRELEPALFVGSKVVADVAAQCAEIGDMHHALEAGTLTHDEVYGELGEIVAGHKPGRMSDDEITVFDSTGMALQDVAAATAVYRRALEEQSGRFFVFNS